MVVGIGRKDKMKQTVVKNTFKRSFVALLVILNCFLGFQYFAHYSRSDPNTWQQQQQQQQLDLCPITPPNLVGEIHPDMANVTLEAIEQRFSDVLELGGSYKPKECISRDRVAIVVSCRGREHQIPIFLKNLHPFLMRQQIEYQIFIVYQTRGYWFNRATLFNVGYVEALKVKRWDCFIFHDVDLLPMNDHNLYHCPRTNPRHMGGAQEKYGFKMPHKEMTGGIVAATVEQYEAVNGHSNRFWGWGAEGTDLYYRFIDAGYYVERLPLNITKYRSLKHDESFKNKKWKETLDGGRTLQQVDGINSLKYHVIEFEKKRSFTRILVDLIPSEMGRDSNDVLEQPSK